MAAKLGIIAGGGSLPARVVEACRRTGREFIVIAVKGHADPAMLGGDVPHAWVPVGAITMTMRILKREHCEEAVMVGAVTRPPVIKLFFDLPILLRAVFSGIMAKGDDALLSKIIHVFEKEGGFRIIGVHEVLPDLLAPEGPIGTVQPGEQAWADIRLGAAAALELGRDDIGQGVVVAHGRVVAREGRAGTDAMLAALDESAAGGVLVKMAKPGQDRRVDLPTIGAATVEKAAAAGLKGIAIEAGGAIIAERDRLVASADAAGLFVVAIAPSVSDDVPKDHPLVYVIAGEDSGDRLGASLMTAMKHKTGGGVRFAGIGGETMTALGLESLFPMRDLAVMGVAEVLPRVPKLLMRIHQTLSDIRRRRPDVVVTIDSPDFVFRVAKRLKSSMENPPPIVHYVAPSVWAWRPKRAKKVAAKVKVELQNQLSKAIWAGAMAWPFAPVTTLSPMCRCWRCCREVAAARSSCWPVCSPKPLHV